MNIAIFLGTYPLKVEGRDREDGGVRNQVTEIGFLQFTKNKIGLL